MNVCQKSRCTGSTFTRNYFDIVMPIKKEWFTKILAGEKRTEFRKCSAHWISRLSRFKGKRFTIKFQVGYSSSSEWLLADCAWFDVIDGLNTDLAIDHKVFALHLDKVRIVL